MIHENKRNVIIVKEEQIRQDVSKDRRIDVWWGQRSKNKGLILALSHLLSTSHQWRKSRLILKTMVSSPNDQVEAEKGLQTFVEQGRIDAEVETALIENSDTFNTIENNSKDADFVFIGLRYPSPEESVAEYSQYLKDIFQKTQGIPCIAYVLSSEEIEFKRIFSSI